MVQCNRFHLQYIGETKRHHKDRFNKHRRTVDKTNTKSTPTAIAEHFRSHNHRYTNMQLIPLLLIHSSRDSIRKARESFRFSGNLETPWFKQRRRLFYLQLLCFFSDYLMFLIFGTSLNYEICIAKPSVISNIVISFL